MSKSFFKTPKKTKEARKGNLLNSFYNMMVLHQRVLQML